MPQIEAFAEIGRLHRPAAAHLFERHAGAPGVQRGDGVAPGHPDRRRGAVGGRRVLPAQELRAHPAVPRRGHDAAVRVARSGRDQEPVRSRDPARRRRRPRATTRPTRCSTTTTRWSPRSATRRTRSVQSASRSGRTVTRSGDRARHDRARRALRRRNEPRAEDVATRSTAAHPRLHARRVCRS